MTGQRLTNEQRGYGAAHRRMRAALLPQAYGKTCPRCGRLMVPGQKLELDHTEDRSAYLGMSHAVCNRSAGGRKSQRQRRGATQALGTPSRQW